MVLLLTMRQRRCRMAVADAQDAIFDVVAKEMRHAFERDTVCFGKDKVEYDRADCRDADEELDGARGAVQSDLLIERLI